MLSIGVHYVIDFLKALLVSIRDINHEEFRFAILLNESGNINDSFEKV